MANPFFAKPILNSPYEYPAQHWELDATGQPTQKVIPKPKKRKDAKEKKSTMENYWIPGVSNLTTYGRWAFAEFTDVFQMEADFVQKVATELDHMIATHIEPAVAS
jgi:hypothetical protein